MEDAVERLWNLEALQTMEEGRYEAVKNVSRKLESCRGLQTALTWSRFGIGCSQDATFKEVEHSMAES